MLSRPGVRNHRYTEWTRWNGSALAPDHSDAGFFGHELYTHRDVGIDYSFDEFENVNGGRPPISASDLLFASPCCTSLGWLTTVPAGSEQHSSDHLPIRCSAPTLLPSRGRR